MLKFLISLSLTLVSLNAFGIQSCVIKNGHGEIKVFESDGTKYSIGGGNILVINKTDSRSHHVDVYSATGKYVATGQTSKKYADPICESINPVDILDSINKSHFYERITGDLSPENCPPNQEEESVPKVRPRARPKRVVAPPADANLYRSIGAIIGQKPFNRRCNQLFINKEGKLGEAGREIIDAVQKHASKCLYNDLNVSSICPNYRSFNNTQKDAFWVYAFASVAQFESSCNPAVDAQGTNDVADGLFQMEYSFRQRKAAGRSRELCKTAGPHPSQDIKFQAQCSISILRDTNCKFGWPLDGRKGYWHLLRSNSSFKIGNTMKKFPGCN